MSRLAHGPDKRGRLLPQRTVVQNLKNAFDSILILNDVTVLAGSASFDLAKKIARKIGASFTGAKAKTFPDGEVKITLGSDIKGGRVVVIQSMHPPVDSNLVQALLMISRAAESASDVTLVAPYLGYARQDRAFLPREIVTIKAVAKVLKAAGASRLITVDIHSNEALGHFAFPAASVSGTAALAKHFAGADLRDPIVVSPDSGGGERARKFADICKWDSIALEKNRDRRTGRVSISTPRLDDVRGRDIMLVDDMISTGGSMIKSAEFLKWCGCGDIHAAGTHALLIGDAAERMRAAGISGITCANTIPGPHSTVDVSSALAAELKSMALLE